MTNLNFDRPLIVVPDDDPAAFAGTLHEDRLKRLGEVKTWSGPRPIGDEQLLVRIKDATVSLNFRSSTIFSRNVLKKCPKLKLISVCGIGYDNVDIQAANELGIIVSNTPGYSTVAVSELALTLALAVAHRISVNDRNVRANGWAKTYAIQLEGKILGVIGTGSIGRRMIQLGKAVGMNVIAWTFHPSPERGREYGVEYVSLEKLMALSDVISLHLPLTSESRGLIGWKQFEMMKPSAILVNTARGAVVDETALIDALESKRIAGAGLDVYAIEPLPQNHPLRHVENAVLSPHTAVMVHEAADLCMQMAVDNVVNYRADKPTYVVNKPLKKENADV
jgi:phosphoglycerate dehydrogenase-like enzyme